MRWGGVKRGKADRSKGRICLKEIVYMYENILINPASIKVNKTKTSKQNQRPEMERLDI